MTRLLLATDFDGTLAPIQKDPAAVVADPELATFLCEAAENDDIAVAVISGRDLDDLEHRLGAMPAYLAGSHGLEIRDPRGVVVHAAPPLEIELDPELKSNALRAGIRIERKKHGLAFHWRESPGVDRDHPIVERFAEWAKAHGLDLIEGRKVAEARVAGSGKEGALRRIAETTGASRVIYAGDDLTDFEALRYAAERGRALFVASSEREDAPGTERVKSRRELLKIFEEEVAG
jgi:trehalose 6-phosphate phosphatase